MNTFKNESLNAILNHELNLGNTVKGEETGWSAKDLVIRLKNPMDIEFSKNEAEANQQLHTFETNDPHSLKSFGVATKKEAIVAPRK